ncbi:MAG: hypothetical protein IJ877_02835 [Candidatus Gastranaerophilales bacterium]|nr:hypothetical protein [Candidatus Gastranaerophilales bacterium]
MLNINPINFTRNFNFNSKKNNNTNFNAVLLKPLECDTVSFTGARNLNHGLLEAFDNKKICEEISQNAKVAESNLRKAMNKNFADLATSKQNPNGIIEPIQVRTKSPRSIREKATSKFEEAIVNHNEKNFINLNKAEDIKRILQDIVGARIIVNQSDTAKNAAIIDRLIQMVEQDELKIQEIEIIMLPEEEGIEPYFDDMDLERLLTAVNMRRKTPIEIKRTPSTSGYSAVHIDVDLSDENMISKNAGYKGEIQIIGHDVAYFKDLEDYCYKVKQNKDIKSGHSAYKPFIDHLNKYFENPDKGDEYKEAFEEYTYKAYLLQRKKDPTQSGYNKTHLPSLRECQMDNLLPKDLDFNHLAKIKSNCDRLYEIANRNSIPERDLVSLKLHSDFMNDYLKEYDSKTEKQIRYHLDQLYDLNRGQSVLA